MLYASAFRAYYFIKGRQGGRITQARIAGRCEYPDKLFNTLQLRSLEKRIKTNSRSRREPVTTLLIREKKTCKYDS